MLKKLLAFFGKRRRGVARVMSLIIAIIFVTVLLPLGICIADQVTNALPQPSNPQLTTAYNSTVNNIEAAFSIADIKHIIPLVFVIISILIGVLIYVIQK